MAKFRAEGNRVYQLPEGGKMGFVVCDCDSGDDNLDNQCYNAKEIARCLNQDDALQEMIPWLLRQKTLYMNAKRTKLLEEMLVKK